MDINDKLGDIPEELLSFDEENHGSNAARAIVGGAMLHLAVARDSIRRYRSLKLGLNQNIPTDVGEGLPNKIGFAIEKLGALYDKGSALTQEDVKQQFFVDESTLTPEGATVMTILANAKMAVNAIQKEYLELGDWGKEGAPEGQLSVYGQEKLLRGLNFAYAGLHSADMDVYMAEVAANKKAQREAKELRRDANKGKGSDVLSDAPEEEIRNKIHFEHIDKIPPFCRTDDVQKLRELRGDIGTLRALYTAMDGDNSSPITLAPRTWLEMKKNGVINFSPEALPLERKKNSVAIAPIMQRVLKKNGYDISLHRVDSLSDFYHKNGKLAHIEMLPSGEGDGPLSKVRQDDELMAKLSCLGGFCGFDEMRLSEEKPDKSEVFGKWKLLVSDAYGGVRDEKIQAINDLFTQHGYRLKVERADKSFAPDASESERFHFFGSSILSVPSDEEIRQKIHFEKIDDVSEFCRQEDVEYLRKLRDAPETLRDIYALLQRNGVESITFYPNVALLQRSGGHWGNPDNRIPIEVKEGARGTLWSIENILAAHKKPIALKEVNSFDQYYERNTFYHPAEVTLHPAEVEESPLSKLKENPAPMLRLSHLLGASMGAREVDVYEKQAGMGSDGQLLWDIFIPDKENKITSEAMRQNAKFSIKEYFGSSFQVHIGEPVPENITAPTTVNTPQHQGVMEGGRKLTRSIEEIRQRREEILRKADARQRRKHAQAALEHENDKNDNVQCIDALCKNSTFKDELQIFADEHRILAIDVLPATEDKGVITFMATFAKGAALNMERIQGDIKKLCAEFDGDLRPTVIRKLNGLSSEGTIRIVGDETPSGCAEGAKAGRG